MSNLLEVAMIDIILSLHRRNWSQRRIARELGINRETVARYLKQAEAAPQSANASPGSTASEAAPKPANAPSGSTASEAAPKPANAPSGSTASEAAPKPANAPPGSAVIEVAPDSVIPPLGSARDSGERGHGRLSECEPWREVVQSKCDLGLSAQRIFQDLSNEHAFAGSYYSVRRFVRRLEPTREFPFRRLECEPGDEAQVDFGTGAPIVGPEGKRRRTHVFRIVLSHSRKAYSEVVYRRQVGKHFVEVERAALVPLPLAPFPSYRESRRTVHRDGHVEVERAYYAVPPEYLAREVWVRWDARLVRIFNQRMEPIVVHTRKEPGRFSTPPELIAPEKISGVERGAAWLLGKVRSRLGPHSTTWAEAMIEVRGVEGVRVLLGLLSLAERHPTVAIEDACKIAVGYGAYRLRTIRALIARQAPKQELLQFLNEHAIIRPMSDYSQWVHDAFQSQNRRNQE